MDKGISFPLVRGDSGLFQTKTGLDLIKGNILQILGTIPGERVMEPEFGSRVPELIFDHLDMGTLVLAKAYTVDAIKRWEPRIDLLRADVKPNPEGASMIIHLEYRYKETSEYGETTVLAEKGGVRTWEVV